MLEELHFHQGTAGEFRSFQLKVFSSKLSTLDKSFRESAVLSICLRFCADLAVYSFCLWSSAFTDVSADQTERMRSDLVSYFCVRLWGEKAERFFDTRIMIPWLSFTLLLGRQHDVSCLSLSEEYICTFPSQLSPLMHACFELHSIMSFCSNVSFLSLQVDLTFALNTLQCLFIMLSGNSFLIWRVFRIRF